MIMHTMLQVRNLPASATEEKILRLFQQAGAVVSCKLVVNGSASRPERFALVEMATQSEAGTALFRFNGHYLDGRVVFVTKAAVAEDQPRGKSVPLPAIVLAGR